jgi:hypothetical protein
MGPGGAQIDQNGDRRLVGAWRSRAGYARLASDSLLYEEADGISAFDFAAGSGDLQDDAAWTGHGGQAGTIEMTGAGVEYNVPDMATVSACSYTASSFDDDHFAEATLEDVTNNEFGGPAVRIASNLCYFASPEASATQTKIRIYLADIAGGTTSLLVEIAAGKTLETGDVIRLEVKSSELKLLLNGSEIGGTVDYTLTTGDPGVAFWNGATSPASVVTPMLSLFDAGSFTSRPEPIEVSGEPSRIFAFERDDDQSKIMVAYATAMDAFDVGGPEWT